jgi:hypothetical protein
MNKIICQKDEICSECDCELPRGSWAYEDKYDDLLCEDCCFEKIENNCGFYPD